MSIEVQHFVTTPYVRLSYQSRLHSAHIICYAIQDPTEINVY